MISTSTPSKGMPFELSGIMALCNVRLMGVVLPSKVCEVKMLNK